MVGLQVFVCVSFSTRGSSLYIYKKSFISAVFIHKINILMRCHTLNKVMYRLAQCKNISEQKDSNFVSARMDSDLTLKICFRSFVFYLDPNIATCPSGKTRLYIKSAAKPIGGGQEGYFASIFQVWKQLNQGNASVWGNGQSGQSG